MTCCTTKLACHADLTRPRARLASLGRSALVSVALSVTLAACAPMQEQLRELINEGRYTEAVSRGERFLDDNRYGPALPEEMFQVESLIAQAALASARKKDTVQAYRAFRKAVPETQATTKQHSLAYQLEAAAWYRDITLQADSIRAHRAFRKRYPGTPSVARSQRREAELAFASAQREGTMAALDRFQILYKRWPAAKEIVARAVSLEAQVGYDEAMRATSVDKWRAFNARFAGTTWATKGLLHEMKLALAEAKVRDTVAAYQAFAHRYKAVRSAASSLSEARRAEVVAAWRALGQRPTDAALVTFLKRYEYWAEVRDHGKAGRQRLALLRLEVAVAAGTVTALESWLTLHQDWKEIGDVRKQARKALVVLSLSEARKLGTRAGFQAFVARFKSWPEAAREVIEATRLSQRVR